MKNFRSTWISLLKWNQIIVDGWIVPRFQIRTSNLQSTETALKISLYSYQWLLNWIVNEVHRIYMLLLEYTISMRLYRLTLFIFQYWVQEIVLQSASFGIDKAQNQSKTQRWNETKRNAFHRNSVFLTFIQLNQKTFNWSFWLYTVLRQNVFECHLIWTLFCFVYTVVIKWCTITRWFIFI